MSIEVVCPACMAINEIADDRAGTKVRCDECNKTFTAPSAQQARKSARAKLKESSVPSAETRARTGPTRQQLIASMVMSFLSVMALAAVVGLGLFSHWSHARNTKPAAPVVAPK